MSRTHVFLNKLIVYALGLFVLAFGIAFSIQAGLGLSPISSIPYVLSQASGISIGIWVIISDGLFMLLQILILRRKFKWIQLTQIFFSFLFGYFVNAATALLRDLTIPGYVGSLSLLAFSIVLIALGITLYVGADLINMPPEGLTAAVAERLGKKFYQVKLWFDPLLVILAVTLAFILEGRLYGVREGTVISALLVGQAMKPIQRMLRPALERLLGEPVQPEIPADLKQEEASLPGSGEKVSPEIEKKF